MMEMEEKKLQPVPVPAARAVWPVDGKERALLPLAWGLGVLFAELLVYTWFGSWGLLVPVVVAAWYGVLFWYRGPEGFVTRSSLLLFGAVCLLALSYANFANPYFRLWNALLLPVLVALHLFEWAGGVHWPWCSPRMVSERLGLLLSGFFSRFGTPFAALGSFKNLSHKRAVYVLLGLGVSLPLLLVVVPLLGEADALFRHLTGGLVEWVALHLSSWMARLTVGLVLAPLFFSLLYLLRRGGPSKDAVAAEARTVDAALPITVLAAMDGLYLLFLAVQFAALFGGERYLAEAGVTYAEYARSGFFQLVAVAGLNLTLGLLSVQFTDQTGRGWRWVRFMSTLLVGVSMVMLGSAAYRMTLYVMEYGLSFKRFLTYWAMVMLLLFFVAALMKIWRTGFSFFKVLLVAGLAGWLMLNYCNVDFLVERYNHGRYGKDQSVVDTQTLALQASDWRSWSVAAQLAAMKEGR